MKMHKKQAKLENMLSERTQYKNPMILLLWNVPNWIVTTDTESRSVINRDWKEEEQRTTVEQVRSLFSGQWRMFWNWVVVMVLQHCDCHKRGCSTCFIMVSTITSILCRFCLHSKPIWGLVRLYNEALFQKQKNKVEGRRQRTLGV